jgi:hypothetical protein
VSYRPTSLANRGVGVGARGALATALLLVSMSAAPQVAAQTGLDPIVTVSVLPGREFTQGERMQINLVVAPPADAPGDLTAHVDGRGAVDGFVQRMWASEYDCPYGGCGSGVRPVPCAVGRACFQLPLQLDVRLPPGRHEFPITVVDARGRQTRLSASVDIRPALDRDGDRLPDPWEEQYELLYQSTDGGPNDDPDGDGVENLEEFLRGTNPRARYARYFAEGSSGDRARGLEQCYTVASLVGADLSRMWMTLVGDEGRRLSLSRYVINNRTLVCPLDRREHPSDRVSAVLVESEKPIVIERVAVTGALYEGPFLASVDVPFGTIGVPAPSTHWMFADGGTDGVLDTFYLAYNPGPGPVEVTFTFRTTGGAIARQRTQILPPGVRTTTWLNVDDAALGRTEAWVDVASTAPILVERAWRFDPPGRTVTHESASPGTDGASSRWFFPEVDGQAAFETTLVLANPDAREAVLYVNLLFTDREARGAGEVRVPPGGRVSLPARAILPDGRASVEIVSLNGVRVLGERTLSGRDEDGAWRVAAVGARAAAPRWTLPSVVKAPEVVVTNVSAFPARVELHFYTSYSYGEDLVQVIDIPARRRAVVSTGSRSLDTLRVTSQPTDRGTADIVVEAERYTAVGGVERARSSGLIGALVP